MTTNTQAASAGSNADAIIEKLANPQANIVTDKATVEVLDTAQVVTPSPQEVAPVEEDWKKRFTGYKASTDTTIHNLRQKASQFDLTVSENAKLKAQLEEAQKSIPQTPDDMLALFSEEEVNGFTKMLDSRVGGLQGKVDELQAEVDRTRQSEAQAAAQQAHVAVVDAVKAAVPEYDTIDRHPEFKKWIGEPDTFGNIRYELLVKAKQSSPPDVGRIVSIYREFADKAVQNTQEPIAPKPTIQELMQAPKSIPTGGNQPITPQVPGRVWNTATSSQFYKDKALGKYSPEEAQALEADLYRALKQR